MCPPHRVKLSVSVSEDFALLKSELKLRPSPPVSILQIKITQLSFQHYRSSMKKRSAFCRNLYTEFVSNNSVDVVC